MTPNEAPVNAIDVIETADAAYQPFPSFEHWARATVDTVRWDAHAGLISARETVSEDVLARARDVAKRAAAIESGAIENLYQLDRGITITIATQTAMWQAAFEKQDEYVRSLIESQLNAYNFVIDFATQATPVAEAWVRVLHERLCEAQKTYKVSTPGGDQQRELRHGQYKTDPNHVRTNSGALHAYAPVHETPMEMARLIQELRSAPFSSAHPVLQAAFAHHALTCIHPFQDGNGRVARALASVYFYRAASIPLLIMAEQRNHYLAALEHADRGDYQPMVSFVLNRAVDAFILVNQSLDAAEMPSPDDVASSISKLYYTRGGYTHHQVDSAGNELLTLLQTELEEQAKLLTVTNQITFTVERQPGGPDFNKQGYRQVIALQPLTLRLIVQTANPASTGVKVNISYRVPRDCDTHDPILLYSPELKMENGVSISNMIGGVSLVAHLQLSMIARKILALTLTSVAARAEKQFRGQGY